MSKNAITNWFRVNFSKFPIVGPLKDCSGASHKEALKEFLPSLIFSTATFWMSSIFLMALKENGGSDFFNLLSQSASSSEILIFSLAFLATAIMKAADDPKDARPFPNRLWHIYILFAIGLMAAGFYAMQRVGASAALRIYFDVDYIKHASLIIASVSIGIVYLTIVYRHQTFDPENEIRKKESDFTAEFERSLAND